MKQINLTKKHKSKLLEMCKIMFPEYDDILFHTLENDSLIGYKYMKSMNFQFKIHWFEFCMTHLAENILGKQIPRDITERYKNFALASFIYNMKSNKYTHPIDYLYSEFLKIKLP